MNFLNIQNMFIKIKLNKNLPQKERLRSTGDTYSVVYSVNRTESTTSIQSVLAEI